MPIPPALETDRDDPDAVEKIVEAFTDLMRAGKTPKVDQWVQRYPQYADQLQDLLSSVAMIEGLKNYSPATSQPQGRFENLDLPDYLGEYRIVREVGRGGMGVVLEAVHETLGRHVAIKVMAPGISASAKHVERFHHEAIAAASLHHTNIVSVFGAGEDQGFHFYVMEYIDGESISRLLKREKVEGQETCLLPFVPTRTQLGDSTAEPSPTIGFSQNEISQNDVFQNDVSQNDVAEHDVGENALPTPMSDFATATPGQPAAPVGEAGDTSGVLQGNPSTDRFKWIANVGEQVADALSYAHEKEILHRDIKPANLVLDGNGTVWLTDFGLAKHMGVLAPELSAMTATGDILGTPQYMAPESLSGQYDCRSETYCLGLTLYEMATGQPAIASGTTAEVIRAVNSSQITPPRKIATKLPVDLAKVIEKALAREPQQRYQSAAEFRDDLRAFGEDRPVAARRQSVWGQMVRFSRRNPLAATLSGMLVATLMLLAVVASAGYHATNNALRDLETKQDRLLAQQQQTEAARQRADENARKIESQFQRAEANVSVALDAFDQTFRQLIARGTGQAAGIDIDGFQEIAGVERTLTAEDAQFAAMLLEFYQKLAVDNDNSPTVQRERATANRRIANVYRLVGEKRKALSSYGDAIATFEQLLEDQPDDIDAVLHLVASRNERASLMMSEGDWMRGTRDLLQSREQLQQHPQHDDNRVRLQVVRTLNQMTSGPVKMMFAESTRPESANGAEPSAHEDHRFGPSFDLMRLISSGETLPWMKTGRPPRRVLEGLLAEAKQFANESIGIANDLCDQMPEDPEVRVARAEGFCNLAVVEQLLHEESSHASLQTAIDELSDLEKSAPENPQYQYLLALTRAIGSRSEPPEVAASLLTEAGKTLDVLTVRYPKMLTYQQLYSAVSMELAMLQIDASKYNIAARSLSRAGDLLVLINEQASRDAAAKVGRQTLFEQFKRLGDRYAENGQFDEAAELELEISRLRKELRAQHSPPRKRGKRS